MKAIYTLAFVILLVPGCNDTDMLPQASSEQISVVDTIDYAIVNDAAPAQNV